MANLLPTKGNLIAAKRSRTLARTGYELMDRKRRSTPSLPRRTPPSRRPTSAWASATASRRRWMWTTP